jgi:hypothetical protein
MIPVYSNKPLTKQELKIIDDLNEWGRSNINKISFLDGDSNIHSYSSLPASSLSFSSSSPVVTFLDYLDPPPLPLTDFAKQQSFIPYHPKVSIFLYDKRLGSIKLRKTRGLVDRIKRRIKRYRDKKKSKDASRKLTPSSSPSTLDQRDKINKSIKMSTLSSVISSTSLTTDSQYHTLPSTPHPPSSYSPSTYGSFPSSPMLGMSSPSTVDTYVKLIEAFQPLHCVFSCSDDNGTGYLFPSLPII